MKLRSLLVAAASLGLLAVTALAADKIELKEVKCVMNAKGAAKAATAVDYNGAKVFFCCNNCAGKFKADPAKHALRANHQLVATKQAKQEKCPLSGGACKPEHKTKVAGVSVAFCCPNCKGKVAKAEGDEQLKLVFSEKAFKKGFALAKKEKEKE